VRLAAVDFFVGFAGGTDSAFEVLDEPEGETALFPAGARAYRTTDATLRHFDVYFSDVWVLHWEPSQVFFYLQRNRSQGRIIKTRRQNGFQLSLE
jgi:hypothetical protein